MWSQKKWNKNVKWILTGVFSLLFLIALIPSNEGKNEVQRTSKTEQTKPQPSVQPLTDEQAKKLFFDESECHTRVAVGDPGSENYVWGEEVKIPVIEAYRTKGQQVSVGSENSLYELARLAAYKSAADGLSREEVAAYLSKEYIPVYQKNHPEMTQQTAEIAAEVGPEVYIPKVIERAKVKCAGLKSVSKEGSKSTGVSTGGNDNARLKADNQPSPSVSPSLKPIASEAVLTASDPNSQINLRSTPSTTSNLLGYGLVGDQVQLLDQTTGNDGKTWYLVKFPRSGAQGWIHEDFVSLGRTNQPLSESPTPSSPPTSASSEGGTYDTPTVSTSGRCNSPDDLDSRGHRCGGRAAGVRRKRKG